MIHYIKKYAHTIMNNPNVTINNESLEENSDAYITWYSYIIRVNCPAEQTLELNETIIDHLVDHNYTADIDYNVIFRFESCIDDNSPKLHSLKEGI